MDKYKILKKAKNTAYNHRVFYMGSNKTVYEAMKAFVKDSSFKIDLKRNIRSPSQIDGFLDDNHDNYPLRQDVIDYCIENFETHWKNLVLVYRTHKDHHTDRGKLKLQTYLILDNNRIFREVFLSSP